MAETPSTAPSPFTHARHRSTLRAIGNGTTTGPRASTPAMKTVAGMALKRCVSHGSRESIGTTPVRRSCRAEAVVGGITASDTSRLGRETNNVDEASRPSSTRTAPTCSASPVRYWKSGACTNPIWSSARNDARAGTINTSRPSRASAAARRETYAESGIWAWSVDGARACVTAMAAIATCIRRRARAQTRLKARTATRTAARAEAEATERVAAAGWRGEGRMVVI